MREPQGHPGSGAKEAFADAHDDGIDHQAVFIYQAVSGEIINEGAGKRLFSAAAVDQEVLAGLLLQPGYTLGNITRDDRGVP